MKKQILTAILVSFLLGSLSQILFCVIFDIKNPPMDDLRDEYRDIKYAYSLSLNLTLAILSLPALFLINKKFQSNSYLRFLFWFLPRTVLVASILLLILFIAQKGGSLQWEVMMLLPLANSLAWWFYWFKIKKFLKNESLTQ